MSYNPIQNEEIINGAPVDQNLLQKIKENFEAQQLVIQDLASRTARYIVAKHNAGANWYEVYSDGWVRQCVHVGPTGSSYNFTATLLVPMANTSYTALATPVAPGEDTYNFAVGTKTTTTVAVRNRGNTGNFPIVVEGFASPSALASLGITVS